MLYINLCIQFYPYSLCSILLIFFFCFLLLHEAIIWINKKNYIRYSFHGGSGQNRTADTRIFSPLLYRLSYRAILWRSGRDLNPRSPAWQAGMLTTTPPDHLVAGEGFEPTTSGLWARRATRLLYPAIFIKMAEEEGFEPPRLLQPVGFQDRSLQPDLGIPP